LQSPELMAIFPEHKSIFNLFHLKVFRNKTSVISVNAQIEACYERRENFLYVADSDIAGRYLTKSILNQDFII
jgi:hypothetical protein